MKRICLLFLLSICCALYSSENAVIKDMFPQLSAEDLKDKKTVLPEACKDRVAFVLVSFLRPAEGEIESWLKPFHDAYKDDKRTAYYTVAMLEGVPGFVIYFIKNGMRSAPENEHDNILVSYDSREEYKKKLGVTDESMHNIFLLDRKGGIAKVYRSKKASAGEIEDMLKTVKMLLDAKK